MAFSDDEFFMTFTFQNPLTQRLPIARDLNNYEVAMRFISVPANFYNVSENFVDVRDEATKVRRIIPAGFYTDARNLVNVINSVLKTENVEFTYNFEKHTVRVTVKEARNSAKLSPALANMFRLPNGTIKGPTSIESSSSILFSGWAQVFYVTTNFTVPQICNGRLEPVLGVIPSTASQPATGELACYVPVKNGRLEQLNINIVTPGMQRIYFMSSNVTVVLHFRRRK